MLKLDGLRLGTFHGTSLPRLMLFAAHSSLNLTFDANTCKVVHCSDTKEAFHHLSSQEWCTRPRKSIAEALEAITILAKKMPPISKRQQKKIQKALKSGETRDKHQVAAPANSNRRQPKTRKAIELKKEVDEQRVAALLISPQPVRQLDQPMPHPSEAPIIHMAATHTSTSEVFFLGALVAVVLQEVLDLWQLLVLTLSLNLWHVNHTLLRLVVAVMSGVVVIVFPEVSLRDIFIMVSFRAKALFCGILNLLQCLRSVAIPFLYTLLSKVMGGSSAKAVNIVPTAWTLNNIQSTLIKLLFRPEHHTTSRSFTSVYTHHASKQIYQAAQIPWTFKPLYDPSSSSIKVLEDISRVESITTTYVTIKYIMSVPFSPFVMTCHIWLWPIIESIFGKLEPGYVLEAPPDVATVARGFGTCIVVNVPKTIRVLSYGVQTVFTAMLWMLDLLESKDMSVDIFHIIYKGARTLIRMHLHMVQQSYSSTVDVSSPPFRLLAIWMCVLLTGTLCFYITLQRAENGAIHHDWSIGTPSFPTFDEAYRDCRHTALAGQCRRKPRCLQHDHYRSPTEKQKVKLRLRRARGSQHLAEISAFYHEQAELSFDSHLILRPRKVHKASEVSFFNMGTQAFSDLCFEQIQEDRGTEEREYKVDMGSLSLPLSNVFQFGNEAQQRKREMPAIYASGVYQPYWLSCSK